ncbi:hypothetical protein CLOM_g795 [Closterium sp. NIES-68]|nr:hypothetical protein CLOM_g795 [Closterium sp. NIES-68]GJP64123.1 hypothetical protein CLOP_g21144 [Closterium sp. NIES-67]
MALLRASMRSVVVLLVALYLSNDVVWTDAATTPTESAALLGMKAFMSPATLFASWKGDPCDDAWLGIICSTTKPQHVVGINLQSLSVKGMLSKHIAWLPFLTILNLQGNEFTGELPKEISTLKFLEHIDVRLNQFTGPIPDFTACTNMQYVELSKNDFKGPFPASLLKHDKIIYIGLAGNSLSGPLPLDFSGLKSLTHMTVADNHLNGTLPESIGLLPSIEAVDVSKNEFSGNVPSTYKGIQKLKTKGNSLLVGGKSGKGGKKKGGKHKGGKHGNKGDAPASVPAPASEPAPPSEAPASAPASEPAVPAPASEPAVPAPASKPAVVKPPRPTPGGVAPLPDPTEQPSAPASLPSPVVRPPVVKPPVVKPPVVKPPVVKPPVVKPPVVKPPVIKPPVVKPPVVVPTPPIVTPSLPPLAQPSLPSMPEVPTAPPTECDTCNLNQVAWRPMADDSTSANPKLSTNASACVCVYPLRFRLHMSMNYAAFDEKKQRDLEMQLADDLIVNYGQVRLLASRPGSVVADMALGPEAPVTTLQPAVVERVLALLRNNQLTLSGFGFVEVTLVEPPSELLLPATPNQSNPDEAPAEESSGGWSAAAIAGVVVGAVLVVALIFLVVVLVRCRPRRASSGKKGGGKKGGSSKRVSATTVVTASSGGAAHGPKKAPVNLQSWSNTAARAPPPPGASMAALAAASAANGAPGNSTPGGSTRRVPGVVVLTLAELQMATDNFSPDRSVNSDPLGTTFVGTLPSGQEIAVKRVEPSVVEGQSDDDFVAVASNMARLKHPNVVQLQGYCVDYGERVLVFEHYHNGSLFDQLHGGRKVHNAADPSQHLTWAARIDIAIATARALVYLHEECVPAIIHRNISSRNILLDKRLKARVAGAGLSFLNPVGADDKSLSDQLVGGFAYNAPEYAMSGIYTAKSDVYSFGVVLLELLTGRKPVDPSKPKPESSLVRWAAPLLHNAAELEAILDSKIVGPLPDATKLAAFAEVITRCIQPEPEFRPSMSKIVSDLNHKVKVLQPGASRHRAGSSSPASSLNGSLAGSIH